MRALSRATNEPQKVQSFHIFIYGIEAWVLKRKQNICMLNKEWLWTVFKKIRNNSFTFVLVLNYLSTTLRENWCIDPYFLLTSAVAACELSASRPCRFTFGERPTCTHWIECWADPRVGLDDLEKRTFLTLPGLELRPLRRPARSQSLCWLRHPRSLIYCE
jgi:hypothetical protein